jgi:hypothetical protein
MCFGSSTQNVVQSTEIPEWLLPYFQTQADAQSNLLPIAQQIYQDNAGYDAFPQERLQDFTTDQLTSMEMLRGNLGLETVQNPDGTYSVVGTGDSALGQEQLSAATDRATQGARSWTETGGSYHTPDQIAAGQVDATYNADTFGADDASRYMDPYRQQVVDRTVAEMEESNDRRRLADQGRAAKAGAYGGSRHGVVDTLREEEFDEALGSTVAQLYDTGYGRATDLYTSDEARGLQAYGANAAVGASDADRSLTASRANQETGLQAWNANREQFNTDQGRMLQSGSLMAGLGGQAQDMGLKDVASLMTIGDTGQAMGQAGLDLQYDDFLRQQAHPYQQFGWLQGALSGQPVENPSMFASQHGQQLGASPFSQMAGAGLAGLAAYQMFCWVAREVYGIDDPRWKRVRQIILEEAPDALVEAYARYGEKLAAFVRDKPAMKRAIRAEMDALLEVRDAVAV